MKSQNEYLWLLVNYVCKKLGYTVKIPITRFRYYQYVISDSQENLIGVTTGIRFVIKALLPHKRKRNGK